MADGSEFVLRDFLEEELLAGKGWEGRGAGMEVLHEHFWSQSEVANLGDEDGAFCRVFKLRHRSGEATFVSTSHENIQVLLSQFALLLLPENQVEPIRQMLSDESRFKSKTLESNKSVR